MVAGMLMPLPQLRAIYEVLLRDGVLVAQDTRCPRSQHPEVHGVSNLQVLCALGSLRSRGLVRKTFTWRHHYWYLTEEGLVFLQQYLHLPPHVIPAPLQPIPRARLRGRMLGPQLSHQPASRISLTRPAPSPTQSTPSSSSSSSLGRHDNQEYRPLNQLREKGSPQRPRLDRTLPG
ncbi:small ribosomal subunit protein eS10-like [Hypanus sabinus]|uniref:small ribosomal subunit protein eS10-like n=1 Tax=Hypanus sabinus TaxID=79690 RepID=UPI0028C40B93|nr:small ribosomal subunit protein eS10-like [Hypanus sabinus]